MARTPGLTAYYRNISAMGKEAIRRKKARGETMHLAPLGYKNVQIGGRSTIVSDRTTWSLVLLAKEMRAAGWTLQRVCKEMERIGLRSQRGKVIGLSSMRLILRRTYRRLP